MSWVDVQFGPDLDPSGEGEVLPILPLPTIEWPGNSVEIKAVEPAHVQMYDDLLAAGQRRIFCPFVRSRPPEDQHTNAAGAHLYAVGTLLWLEELQEVSAQTGGSVKYVAKHSVEGLAKISRVLNPSTLFVRNQQGMRRNYTKAEVHMLDDPEDSLSSKCNQAVHKTSAECIASSSRLTELWEDLRLLAERAEEPRLQSDKYIRDSVLRAPTWQLADLWQRLQLSTVAHRERVKVTCEVREWIEVQQQEGRLPRRLPPQIDVTKLGLPAPLVEAFVKSQSSAPTIPPSCSFWEPLLRLLETDGPEARRELLVRMAEREVEVTRTRAQLKEMLG